MARIISDRQLQGEEERSAALRHGRGRERAHWKRDLPVEDVVDAEEVPEAEGRNAAREDEVRDHRPVALGGRVEGDPARRFHRGAKRADEEPIDEGSAANEDKSDKERAEEKKNGVAKVKTDVDFALTSDKDVYKLGETPVFTVVSSKDCFLTLTNIDEKDTLTVLLPNKFQQDNRIKAGVPVSFPGAKAPFIYKLGDKGKETVMAVCSDKPEVDGIKHDFNKAPLTTVKNNTRSIGVRIYKQGATRKIEILPAGGGAPAPNGKVAVAPKPSGSDIKRTAIKIDVR